MPLQIMLAVLLALLTLGAKWQTGSGQPQEVTIVGGSHYARVFEKERSNIIVITTVERSNNRIMILGQRHTGDMKNIFTSDTTLSVNGSNKQSKRNIYRAA